MKKAASLMVLSVLFWASTAAASEDTYTPSLDRIRAGLAREAPQPERGIKPEDNEKAPVARSQTRFEPVRERRDSVWNGALIGAAAGAGGGYIWAHNICGPNDSECFAIAGPVGILTGAGIGAAVGAIVDLLHR
jgi:hypothetical protein